nr:integrase, catalytic region, zinc finger, CCHC-type, peptidase aspartic, catalytic [Tanacetum cinerariifolium]
MMRQNKNLIDINIDALYNILKKNQGDINDAMGSKKKTVVVTSDPLALIPEKTKVSKSKEKVVVSLDFKGSDADDFSELKKITALLAKAFNRRKFYSKPTNNNLRTSSTSVITARRKDILPKTARKQRSKIMNITRQRYCLQRKIKMNKFFWLKIKHGWNQAASLSSANEKISKLNEQLKESIKKNNELLAQMKVLKDQLQVKHVVIDTHVECQEKYAKLEAERYEYMIRYSAYFDNDKQHRKQIADQEVLYDKMSAQLVELDKHVSDLKNTVLEKEFKIFELEECVRNKDLEIEKCLECLNVCENKLHKMGQTNQTIHMIMPSKDNLYNGQKGIGFENPSYFKKAKDSRLTLYDEKVIGLGYTLMFLTHSDEPLEIEKFKRSRENKIEFAYDYGNLNKKGSSNTSNVDLSAVSVSNLNKNVKRYSRKDLLACNNSHLGETSSASVCNDAMNVSCNYRMCDLLDDNNFFIFDDESIKISLVSKLPFRKKPCDSMNVSSKSNMIKSLPRTVRCSKHMMGNRALLTSFVEKFLGTVRFGNNDFAVIVGYGDAVIGSMTIKKVYYVKG